jgi:hypothetical protein
MAASSNSDVRKGSRLCGNAADRWRREVRWHSVAMPNSTRIEEWSGRKFAAVTYAFMKATSICVPKICNIRFML